MNEEITLTMPVIVARALARAARHAAHVEPWFRAELDAVAEACDRVADEVLCAKVLAERPEKVLDYRSKGSGA